MSIVVVPAPCKAGPPPPLSKVPGGSVTGVEVSETMPSNTVCTTRGEAAGFQRISFDVSASAASRCDRSRARLRSACSRSPCRPG